MTDAEKVAAWDALVALVRDKRHVDLTYDHGYDPAWGVLGGLTPPFCVGAGSTMHLAVASATGGAGGHHGDGKR